MIYGAPGVGKTSILDSLIIPILEDQFEIPPVVRVGLGRAAIISDQMMTAIHNIYVFSVLQRLAPNVDPTLLMKYTFCQFLNDYFPPKVDRLGRGIPPIIVFDQLEELFEFYPERWLAQQEDFFTQIADALNGDPDLGIVLVIREHHLAHLDHFASILPEKLKIRFRLEPLHKDAALAGQYSFKLFVRLWNDLRYSTDEISIKYFHRLGDVDKTLEDFYEQAVLEASKQTDVSENTIRNWIEDNLITTIGTRGIVSGGSRETDGISNKVLDILENKYLIRKLFRSGVL